MDQSQSQTMGAQVVIQDRMAGAREVAQSHKRNLKEFWKKALDLAELSGDDAYFLWEQRSRDKATNRDIITEIKGLSASAVQSTLMLYQNIWSEPAPVQETANGWVFTVLVTDLENNSTISRQYRMDKNYPVYGKHDEYRKNDIRFAIGYSKASRNAGKALLPPGLEDAMIEVARNSVRGKIEKKIADYDYQFQQRQHKLKGLVRYADELVAQFALVGIELSDLEKRVDVELRGWTVETFVQLVPDLKALKGGTLTLAEYLEAIHGPKAPVVDSAATGSLSPDSMKAGDASKHQGYETEKADEPNANRESQQSRMGIDSKKQAGF